MLFRRTRTKPGTYNFTEQVRRALRHAREEAVKLRHGHIGTEHLLLGLLAEPEGVGASVLKVLGSAPDEVREALLPLLEPGAGASPIGEVPYTSDAKQVLALAMGEAREIESGHIGTEHLLLGLLAQRTGIAGELLDGMGIDYRRARAETLRLVGAEPRPADGFRVRLDDASDVPIYEQIVAGVREGVATGRLRPGERLPTVRKLADELDIAPGTVARAYAELERLGVVVTDGARGTRVAEQGRDELAKEKRPEVLVGLLRPVAVAAFHLGATDQELRTALDAAMRDIF